MERYIQLEPLPPQLETWCKENGWENENENFREHWRQNARAGLMEMREPTEWMKFKGYNIRACADLTKMIDTWKAMIDAALK